MLLPRLPQNTLTDDVLAFQRSQKMHNLDMKYQGTSHQYSIVVKEEEARRLKLRSVLLGDENATLKDQLARKDDQITRLTSKCDTFRDHLENATQAGRQQEKQIRLQARELSTLKVNTLVIPLSTVRVL